MFTRFNEKVIIVQCCLWFKRPRLTHLYLSHISFLSIWTIKKKHNKASFASYTKCIVNVFKTEHTLSSNTLDKLP